MIAAKVTLYDTAADLGGLAAEAVVGDSWKFTLDPDGKIFVAEAVDAKGDYALVIATEEKDSYGKNTGKIKVMDNTGAVVELTLKGTADPKGDPANVYTDVDYINGKEKAALKDLADTLKAGDIITYATNSAGKVTEIEEYTLADGNHKMSTKGVYGDFTASKDTIIFTYEAKALPADKEKFDTDEDKYAVSSFAKVAGEKDAFPAKYYADKGDIEVMIILDNVGGSDDSFGMINTVSDIKNADDDDVFEYEALIDGKEVVLNTDENASAYNVLSDVNGEFYILTIDGEGVVTGVTPVKDGMTVEVEGIAPMGDKVAFDAQQTLVADIDKTAGWIAIAKEFNEDGTVTSTKYTINDNRTVYKMVFDNDDAFDGYVIGSFSDVVKGALVLAFDTVDDDEEMYDTFVVVKRADIEKWAAAQNVGH